MRTHKFNEELSKAVYESCKDLVMLKDCYANIWRISSTYMRKLKSGKWKIAYGYMPCFGDLYARHCFMVNEYGEAVDPTAILIQRNTQSERSKAEYMSFALLDYDEYLELVEENSYCLDLSRALSAEEDELREETTHILVG